MNKIRTPINDEVGMPAKIHTANLKKGDWVKITGDATVDIITVEDDFAVGFVFVGPRVADGKGTVMTRYDYLIDMLCDGAIAAGEFVKLGEAVGGEQTLAKFTPGVDAPQLNLGICWVGAADNVVGTFLVD
jgi:hypothetical protein